MLRQALLLLASSLRGGGHADALDLFDPIAFGLTAFNAFWCVSKASKARSTNLRRRWISFNMTLSCPRAEARNRSIFESGSIASNILPR